MTKSQKMLMIGVIFSIFVYIFYQNFTRPLFVPDETRTAQVAQEMISGNEPNFLRLNGNRYYEKPPLYFWFIYLFSKISGGVNEASVRMPAFMSLLGLVVLSFLYGRNLGGVDCGYWSAFICSTIFSLILLAQTTSFDILLTFFICAGLYFFLGKNFQTRQNLNSKDFILGFIFFGFATLTKGFIGFFLPIIIIFSCYIITDRLKYFLKWQLVGGIFICFAIVSIWFIPVLIKEGSLFIHNILGEQTFERIVSPQRHQQPWYYYFLMFPLHTLPWSIFFFFILFLRMFKKIIFSKTELMLLLWIVVVIVFFTLPKGKGGFYTLPMIFPFVLICGLIISKNNFEVAKKFYRGYCFVLCAVILLIIACVCVFLHSKVIDLKYENLLRFFSYLFIILFLTFFIFLLITILSRKGYLTFLLTGLYPIVILISVENITSSHLLFTNKSTKNFVTEVKRIIADDELIFFDIPEHFLFYSGRVSVKEYKRKEFDKFIEKMKGEKKIFCITNLENLDKIRKQIEVQKIISENVDNDNYVLICNK